MRHAYNETSLYNLSVIKQAKALYKSHWIGADQFQLISNEFATPLYHPNFLIRLLLFIATLVGLSGVTGIFALMIADTNQTAISIACVIYGAASLFLVDRVFIKDKHHYKSGVNEALLYHSIGFVVGGLIVLLDAGEIFSLWIALLAVYIIAYRYLDLLSTLGSLLIFSYLLFYHLYEMGGLLQQIIPFAFLIVFALGYSIVKAVQKRTVSESWNNQLLLIESYCLLLIYLAGNYLVVRELSVNLMSLELTEGEDIPFAFLFYALTVIIPALYMIQGIIKRDIVILRISLLVVAFSVFTFKYYYGFNQPEITLTVAGLVLLTISLALFKYLKTIRRGFTRENLIAEKWGNMNAEAFIISQTLGGNQVRPEETFAGKGGEFGGGGSSGSF